MTPATFEFFSTFLKERSGLHLQVEKQYLLENRLKPLLTRFDVKSFDALVKLVQSSRHGDVATAVTQAMTVTETSFFRDKTPFDLFVRVILPDLLNKRPRHMPIRIWSAAASSGQEAYTLAMMCKENAAMLAGHKVEIIATDISEEVLEKAKAGIYSQFEVQRGMPVQLLLKYFEQTGEMWKLVPEIRSMVTFQPFNLMSEFAGLPQFDVVFCRNVLIYFDVPTKAAVFKRIKRVIASDGYLMLGGAETAIGISDEFKADKENRLLFRPAEYVDNATMTKAV